MNPSSAVSILHSNQGSFIVEADDVPFHRKAPVANRENADNWARPLKYNTDVGLLHRNATLSRVCCGKTHMYSH